MSIFFSNSKVCPFLRGQLNCQSFSMAFVGGTQVPKNYYRKRYKSHNDAYAIALTFKIKEVELNYIHN